MIAGPARVVALLVVLMVALMVALGPGCSSPSTPAKPVVPAPAETLAFAIHEGAISNHFFRRGPIAAHVLVSSGLDPRLIVAFPAGNTGIGVWFDKVAVPVQFAVDGELAGVERADRMRGVGVVLTANTDRLAVRGAVLGSIRTIRDFAHHGTAPPETAHQTQPGPPVVLRRTTADGKHHVELILEPRDGTTAIVEGDRVVLLAAAKGGTIRVHATALADDDPLTPIPMGKLVTGATASSERDLRALAFLSYQEKLLAGSWRFLTYFGRDTLLSVRLLLPVLQPDVTEAALGSVLDGLAPDGDVAHEEDIGDFATLRHLAEKSRPADLNAPIYDYKMVDDDFLLGPVLVSYLLDTETGRARAQQFLDRKTTAGHSYAAALERNLDLVIKRATPFADKPGPTTLVALMPGIPVGEWRDSEIGLGHGRYAFDINVALVPAALEAAARLYESPLLGAKATAAANARRLATAWQGAAALFRVEIPEAVATARLSEYATSQGIDAGEALASIKNQGPLVFHALSLDAAGAPIPVMHTDDGFVLLFMSPSPEYLAQVASRLTRAFPAGLRTPVGMVVANPAFVTDPKLRDLFSRGHYHGAVVWSWQQAMLAAGLARQLARSDLPLATVTTLAQAEQALWTVIDATAEQRTGELWTWDVKDRRIVLAPFGQGAGHTDESNAVQLWSTVYLGVKRPAKAGGPR